MTQSDRLTLQHRKRLALLLVLVVLAALVAASNALHGAVVSMIGAAEPLIRQHAVAGAVLFVLLSALSAIVFFFSTAVITPVAVEVYGPIIALLMLWLGWVLGGITAYAIGRRFGRGVVSWFVDPSRIRDYERRARGLVSFRRVLLFQLAVPSEIPGYVLGLAGCPFRKFLLAMALGELPFAAGAVFLGESFLDRNYVLLLAIGIGGAAFSWMMFRRLRSTPSPRSDRSPGRTDSRPLSESASCV